MGDGEREATDELDVGKGVKMCRRWRKAKQSGGKQSDEWEVRYA